MRILKVLAILAVICCTFAAKSFAGVSMNVDFTSMSVARWNGSTSWMPLQQVNGVRQCEVGDVIGLWVTNSATPGATYSDVQWAQAPVLTPRGYFGTLMNVRIWTASKVGRVDLYSIISEMGANGFQSRPLLTSILVNPKSITITGSLALGTDGAYTLYTTVSNLSAVSQFAPRIDLEMVGDKINAKVYSDRNASVVISGKTGLAIVKDSGRMLCSWKAVREALEISDLTASKCSLHLPSVPAGSKITTMIKLVAPSYSYEVKSVDSSGNANGPAVLPNALGYRILAVGQHYKVFAHVAGKTDAQINVLMGNRYNGEYPLRTLVSISNNFWCTGEGGGTMFITLNDSTSNAKIIDFPFNIYAVDLSQTDGK